MKLNRLFTIIAIILLSTMTNAQTVFKTVQHYPWTLKETDLNMVKSDIAMLIKKETKVHDGQRTIWANPKDVQVFDDRIEFTLKDQKEILIFSYILDSPITVDEISMSENNGPYCIIDYEINLSDLKFYFHMDYESAMKMGNDLYFVQQDLKIIQQKLKKERLSSLLAQFRSFADSCRLLKEKPVISEEMRKYIVQANAFNQKKQYAEAIALYKKAIAKDAASYPAAYSNLALLSAQTERFDEAIFYMQEYLLLEPEASDARTAQDKIYEWESQIAD